MPTYLKPGRFIARVRISDSGRGVDARECSSLVNGELIPNVDVSAAAEPEANAHAFETIRANFRPENLKKPIQPSQPTGKVPTC